MSRDWYDPEVDLDADDWLAADGLERTRLVEEYHRDEIIGIPEAAQRMHACLHVVVENQLASQDEAVVRALARLMEEGLSRHDALHAIACVVREELHDLLERNVTPETADARYYAGINRLTAATWGEYSEE
jgi:hypothetical protein